MSAPSGPDDGSVRPEGSGPKGAATRQHLLSTAIALFGDRGFRATSVAQIARTAGVSGSLVYAYFADKDDLFREALDADTADLIATGVATVINAPPGDDRWRHELMTSLLTALESRPLARRVIGGLEPHVTSSMIDLPALVKLRAAVGRRLADDQAAGVCRADIDTAAVGEGLVMIWISLLMSLVQFGPDGLDEHWPSVFSVFDAALSPTHPVEPR